MDITVPEGPSVIHDSIDALRIVQQNMRAAHSRQKSYVGNFRRMLQFEVNGKVFLKVLPTREKEMNCLGVKQA